MVEIMVSTSELRQYVVAARLATPVSSSVTRATAKSLISNLPKISGKQHHEYGPAVVEITDHEADVIRSQNGHEVIVAPLVKYSVARIPTFPVHARRNAQMQLRRNALMQPPAAPAQRVVTFRVTDSDNNPVEEVRVVGFFSLRWRWGTEGVTDANGVARLVLEDRSPNNFEVIYIYPPHSFWPTYRIAVPVIDQSFSIEALPEVNGFQWWADLIGIKSAHDTGFRGQNVKVAVVDTGVGPHPDLDRIVQGRNFTIDGQGQNSFQDVDGHGTHVAGIIGAKAADAGGLVGVAPDAEIFAARVFPNNEEGADSGDVAAAIETAVSEWNCDVINLSLGGPYDTVVEDRINYATQNGVLCVAAAGNSGGPVEYPGALQRSFCVAALGALATYPAGSIHEEAEPESRGLFGLNQLYSAEFTCRGEQVDACAPGVAIISTVPNSHYAALDGTSMACPMVAGIAAIVLSRNDAIRNHIKNGRRIQVLRAELQALLDDVRLPNIFQGGGMIRL